MSYTYKIDYETHLKYFSHNLLHADIFTDNEQFKIPFPKQILDDENLDLIDNFIEKQIEKRKMRAEFTKKIISFEPPNGEKCSLACGHIVETPVVEGDYLEMNDLVFCFECYVKEKSPLGL